MLPVGERFGRIVQIAYLVEDIDAAMAHWLRNAGLGPWTCFRNIELATTYEGREFTMHIHEALAYTGELQIQLVQSLDGPDVETPYRAFVEQGRWGVHHVAFFADDIDASVAQMRSQGFERICAMRDAAGHRYYYARSSLMPDVWIELLESYPALHEIFEQGIAAAAAWDGRDAIRSIEYSEIQAEIQAGLGAGAEAD